MDAGAALLVVGDLLVEIAADTSNQTIAKALTE